MQLKNGYLTTEDAKMIRKCDPLIDGQQCFAWYNIESIDYLFKIGPEVNLYLEVLWSRILKEIGLNAVQYLPAEINNRQGIIVENFNPAEAPVISMDTFLKKYNRHCQIEFVKDRHLLYNVTDLKSGFDWYFKKKMNEIQIQILKEDLLQQFIIQLLAGNNDLHEGNMNIIQNQEKPSIPFYDFGHYGFINIEKAYFSYELSYGKKKQNRVSPSNTISEFLENGTKEEIAMLYFYLDKMKKTNIRRINEELESSIHKKINPYMYQDLEKKLNANCRTIETIGKKVRILSVS